MRGILIEPDPDDAGRCLVSIPEGTPLRAAFDAVPDEVKDDFVVVVLAVVGREQRCRPRLKPGCLELRAVWLQASTERNLALGEGDYLARQAWLHRLCSREFVDGSDLLQTCLDSRTDGSAACGDV